MAVPYETAIRRLVGYQDDDMDQDLQNAKAVFEQDLCDLIFNLRQVGGGRVKVSG